MGAAGVLGAAYAMLAQEADAKDQTAGMLGDAKSATHREDLDDSLDEPLPGEEVSEQEAIDTSNVTDLGLWVARANQLMGE